MDKQIKIPEMLQVMEENQKVLQGARFMWRFFNSTVGNDSMSPFTTFKTPFSCTIKQIQCFLFAFDSVAGTYGPGRFVFTLSNPEGIVSRTLEDASGTLTTEVKFYGSCTEGTSVWDCEIDLKPNQVYQWDVASFDSIAPSNIILEAELHLIVQRN